MSVPRGFSDVAIGWNLLAAAVIVLAISTCYAYSNTYVGRDLTNDVIHC